MFDVTTGASTRARRSPEAAIASILLHGAVAAILLWIALSRVAVEKPPEIVEVTFFSTPPPPPPPPPAGPSKPKTQKKKETPKTQPEELVQPQEIPEEIPETTEVPEEEPEEGGQVGGVAGGQAGGVVGGQLGGEVGGDIASLGISESKGLCLRKPEIRYPEQAKQMGIEGTVQVKILIDVDGKIVKRKDAACAPFLPADKAALKLWHPQLCMEVQAGPEVLHYETLTACGLTKWGPYKSGNVNTRYWARFEVNFRLK